MYEINLLPPKLQREVTIDRGKLFKLVLVVVAVLVFAGGYGGFIAALVGRGAELAEVRQEIATLETGARKYDQELSEFQRLNKEAAALENLLVGRVSVNQVLNDINRNLPVDITISAITVGPADSLPGGGYASPVGSGAVEDKEAAAPDGQKPAPAPAAQAQAPAQAPAGSKDGQKEPGSAAAFPDKITISGTTQAQASVGVLINSLKGLPYISAVRLVSVAESEFKQFSIFTIEAFMIGAEENAAEVK